MFRGLCVWLAPPVLGSTLCTLIWHLTFGISPALFIGVMSLLFTVGGSTILTLMYAQMSDRSVAARYVALTAVGPILGGLVLLVLTQQSVFMMMGAFYGATTAALWVVMHRLLYPEQT